MIIIPAIDLLGGMCVRLRKGEYGTASKVAEDPAETLLGFAEAGAEYIHLVDLDGAKAGVPVNDGIIRNLIKLSPVPVEIGGGIRTYESAKDYLDAGAGRIILGSVALTSPELVKRLAAEYGSRIAVGIDARNGIVKTSGWLEDSDALFDTLAYEMEKAGVRCVIYTDIERYGMLSGVDLNGL
ncbi:MAG: 1-(5-phosphoribosyl)-5-((5-phosphoribosylamino)methylideneamino)imidazole-4-carboxamide isomerase, partial [Clostridia bacterium]|nr:1-(5-phosphoribosyl)-5-((5-phosphoribosylamino)methylideneamino)imidazole-4-carboxamide isomerase [Clostridia bacterium]